MTRAPLRVVIGMPLAERLGGAERLLQSLIDAAPDLDLEPQVVFFHHGPWEAELAQSGIATTVIEPGRFRSPRSNARAAVELRRLFARERPDVILGWISRAHVTFAPAAVAAGLAGRLAWCQHHIAVGELLERAAVLMPARLIVANSHATASTLAAMRPRRPTEVVHPGIEIPALRPPSELAALRERLGIPPERSVAGVVGRLVRLKAQDRVIESVAALRAEGRDVHGLLVGGAGHGLDLGYEAELRALATRLGVDDRITFAGQVADPLPYVELMDVLVNAAEIEGFGLALLEAMAVAVPVVAVDRAGPPEIVRHGENGLLVPSNGAPLLAAAVRELLDDPDRARQIALTARDDVRVRFPLDRWLGGFRSALERVAA